MTSPSFSRYDIAAWILFGVGLLWLLFVHLLPSLLAGLLIFALVDALVPLLRKADTRHGTPRMLAVALIATIVIAATSAAILSLVSFMRNGGDNLPALIQRMAEIIEHSRASLPAWLLHYVPQDTEELRQALVTWLRTHAEVFQVAGTGVGRALAHIVVGMVIGALLSLENAGVRADRGPLSEALAERARHLILAFRRVVFAQVRISAINTAFTAIYLLVVLPWFDVQLPFAKTLVVLTFVLGLIPILGNLISNTMIFTVSLSQSLGLAVASLSYLVIIHKLEYFLNARIVGGQIRARAWELLLAMLAMEAAFGITGLMAAPIHYAYVKDELRDKKLI
ncbi:MAG: AI-2E family transporter [Proteobacteria bacterium]|nr:AI-2E family transporter [Pseudomonadota bacterium]